MTHGRKPRQKEARKGVSNRFSERDYIRNVKRIDDKHQQRRAPRDDTPETRT